MKRYWIAALGLVMACAGRQTTAETARGRAILLLEVGISEGRADVIRPMIGDDYRQHNPRVSDGPEGLLSFVAQSADQPPSRRVQIENLRSFEDGEFIVLHSLFRRGSTRISGFDVFRVRDGLLVEHWDVGMVERGRNASRHGLLDGAMTDTASLGGNSETTRGRVRELVEAGLINHDAGAMGVVAEDVAQHDPRFGDGRRAWIDSLSGELRHLELVRTIAQGEWALTQSRGELSGAPAVIYDLFHLDGREVVEHWVVWERVPERMRHSNGML